VFPRRRIAQDRDVPSRCRTGGVTVDWRRALRFTPPFIFDRIRAQTELFTVRPDPTKIFYREGRKVLRIPRARVNKFRKTPCKYDVDHWYIDPDAQGLGQQMRWQYKSKTGLGSVFMDKD
jgi:hypothetical protein